MQFNKPISYASQSILDYLAQSSEPQDLVAITIATGLSYSTVSTQTRLLSAQGLIERNRTGKVVTFRLKTQEAI